MKNVWLFPTLLQTLALLLKSILHWVWRDLVENYTCRMQKITPVTDEDYVTLEYFFMIQSGLEP